MATAAAVFRLIPILPSFFGKYGTPIVERDASIQTKTTIPAITRFTSFTDDIPLPRDWFEHVHPEGNTYFSNPKLRVVSNTDPRRAGVTAILNNAAERIRTQLSRDQKPDGPEVYLNVSDDSRFGPEWVVEYYLVDYSSRAIFWIENIDILTNLGGIGSSIEPFESTRHLRSALEPEFWVHVEYYPCHQLTYDQEAEKKLTAVLQHGCVDDMTAPGSVFPYGADECVRYLKMLERFPGDDKSTESFRRSWIARLWTSICRSRHINRYGLPYPRLDRLQGLDSYLKQQNRKSVAMALGEICCLGMSKEIFYQLTELWNGRIVYQRHWQPFLERQRSEWKWTTFGGLYLLMMNAVQWLCGTSIIAVASSASFACSSILVSALMIHAHSVAKLKTASDISSYIYLAESFDHGLRPLSITFTLPKALLGYAVLISAGNTLHHVTSQLQDDPTQLLHTSAAAFLPLLTSVVMYRAYGPSTI